jgi:hypothetical protein
MIKQAMKYGFGAITLYLLVANASGTGTLFSSGANGIATVTKTFQGRP